jgi:hypothetical protein
MSAFRTVRSALTASRDALPLCVICLFILFVKYSHEHEKREKAQQAIQEAQAHSKFLADMKAAKEARANVNP